MYFYFLHLDDILSSFIFSGFFSINKSLSLGKEKKKKKNFVVTDDLPKSVWLVRKVGRLTAGLQYEPDCKFTQILFL